MDLYKSNMWWKRKECPLRRIDVCRKSQGKIGICVGMYFCIIIVLVVLFQGKLLQYQVIGTFVEDSLASSNLASAVIDVKEYGRSHNILIESPEGAFNRYREALIYNLQLNSDLGCKDEEVLCGKFEILSYQIFNVIDDTVEVCRFEGDGRLLGIENVSLEQAYLPDGKKVETTSIYSKVGFYMRGLGDKRVYVTKEKTVDIKGEG